MSSTLDYDINVIAKKVAAILNLEKWSLVRNSFEKVAQNYFGLLIPATISGEGKCGKCDVHLVLKLAPTDERFRVSGALTLFFAREIYVYSVILRKYYELQLGFPTLLQFVMPKCYYVCKDYCNEAIVMQDMTKEGYKPYVNEMFLDLEHINLSLKSLAQFHALSFVLKKRDNTLYEEISKTCVPLSEKTNKRFMDIMRDRLMKATEKLDGTKYTTLLDDFKDNCVKYIEALAEEVSETCLCHGDIWKENILFKYEANIPVSACLIDYQTARISSPAFDVLYLIASSADQEIRKQHIHQLLDTYYVTFGNALAQDKLDANDVYSRQMFDKDLATVAPACFIVANTALWLSNGLQEEGHVRSKCVWNTEEEKRAAVDKYTSIIRGIINDFYSYGYFK